MTCFFCGDQCAVMRIVYARCLMELRGAEPNWAACPRSQGGCIARCVGCGCSSHVCQSPPDCLTGAEGLCPECLRRADLLAAEGAGQQRLVP